MAWKYRPHARYSSIWSAEIGGSIRKNSLLLLTMPASLIATSHLMFSDTPLTIFWANYVDDEDDCESLALLKFNWVATGPCVVGTWCTFPWGTACVCFRYAPLSAGLEPPDLIYEDVHKIACFFKHFGWFDIPHTIANCILYCHFLIALIKSTIQTHTSIKWMECSFSPSLLYIKWLHRRRQMWRM